jgi:hypothetical protein
MKTIPLATSVLLTFLLSATRASAGDVRLDKRVPQSLKKSFVAHSAAAASLKTGGRSSTSARQTR